MSKRNLTPMPLEGPVTCTNGRTVYYDYKEGKYYDQSTDMYLTDEEAFNLTAKPAPWGMAALKL